MPGDFAKEGNENDVIAVSPTGVVMSNISLRSCIRWAHGLRDNQIAGPAWIASERFDISAKTDEVTALREMKTMMGQLLAERFKLVLRQETKELPAYSMVVGKNGSKLRSAPAGTERSLRPMDGALEFRSRTFDRRAANFCGRRCMEPDSSKWRLEQRAQLVALSAQRASGRRDVYHIDHYERFTLGQYGGELHCIFRRR